MMLSQTTTAGGTPHYVAQKILGIVQGNPQGHFVGDAALRAAAGVLSRGDPQRWSSDTYCGDLFTKCLTAHYGVSWRAAWRPFSDDWNTACDVPPLLAKGGEAERGYTNLPQAALALFLLRALHGRSVLPDPAQCVYPIPHEVPSLHFSTMLLCEEAVASLLAPHLSGKRPHILLLGPGLSCADLAYARRFCDVLASAAGQPAHLDVYERDDFSTPRILSALKGFAWNEHTYTAYLGDQGDFTSASNAAADLVLHFLPFNRPDGELCFHYQRFLAPGGIVVAEFDAMGSDPYPTCSELFAPWFDAVMMVSFPLFETLISKSWMVSSSTLLLQRTTAPRAQTLAEVEPRHYRQIQDRRWEEKRQRHREVIVAENHCPRGQ